MKTAKVLYGATDLGPPHFSSDILWKTRFKAPDPFFFVEIESRSFLLLSSLEFGRGKKEAAGEVVSLERYARKGKGLEGAVASFLREYGIQKIAVPPMFPHHFGRVLGNEFVLEILKEPIFPERARKNEWEVAEIEKAQRAVEVSLQKAMDFLRRGKIQKNRVVVEGREVTSEILRKYIDQDLYDQGFLGIGTIVASGIQAADPHCAGSGPIQARVPLVLDIFPLSLQSHYYADQTRTIFIGEPGEKYKKMYEAVLEAQTAALKIVRAGVDGHELTEVAKKVFEARGYPTEIQEESMDGFIHGLGHGVGIDIHEWPSLGSSHVSLEEGNVVTIEPGLYYQKAKNNIPAGGTRIEDMVLVEKGGARNLTQFPKDLRSAIIELS